MKLGGFRRIYKADFNPEFQQLADQIGTTVNDACDQLFDALDNKLSFRDNIAATIVELTVAVSSTGVPLQQTVFSLNPKQTVVEGIWAISCVGATDANLLPESGIFVSAVRNGNKMIVKNIKGLQAQKAYKIKLLVIS